MAEAAARRRDASARTAEAASAQCKARTAEVVKRRRAAKAALRLDAEARKLAKIAAMKLKADELRARTREPAGSKIFASTFEIRRLCFQCFSTKTMRKKIYETFFKKSQNFVAYEINCH